MLFTDRRSTEASFLFVSYWPWRILTRKMIFVSFLILRQWPV